MAMKILLDKANLVKLQVNEERDSHMKITLEHFLKIKKISKEISRFLKKESSQLIAYRASWEQIYIFKMSTIEARELGRKYGHYSQKCRF